MIAERLETLPEQRVGLHEAQRIIGREARRRGLAQQLDGTLDLTGEQVDPRAVDDQQLIRYEARRRDDAARRKSRAPTSGSIVVRAGDRSAAMPRLLLVRHAQSENNVTSDRIRATYAGDLARIHLESERARQPDPELSELGRRQAELLADRLAPLLREPGTALISSPMRRALQTAAPLIRRAGLDPAAVVCEPELFEVGGCYYADEVRPSLTPAQIAEEFGVRCSWSGARGWFDDRTGPESDDEARARVDRLIGWMEERLGGGQHERLVLIVHGDLMTRWLRRWLGVPWSRSLAFVHANTGITTLCHDRRAGLLLESLNDTGHLPATLRTGDGSGGWYRYVSPDLEIVRYGDWREIPDIVVGEIVELRKGLFEREGLGLGDYRESDLRNVHFVARADGHVAGYVQYDPQLGRLRQMVVAPAFRGSGLGARLVEAVVEEARRSGRGELRVHAWVESVGFYRGVGFVEAGEVVRGQGVDWQALVRLV